MNLRLMMLCLAFVLTASLSLSSRNAVAADSQVVGSEAVAVTHACGEFDLVCIRRLLLEKQDEVLSMALRLGLREKQVKLLEDAAQLSREQLLVALGSNKTLLEASLKIASHWWDSKILWFGIGVFLGGGLVVLTSFAVAQVFSH